MTDEQIKAREQQSVQACIINIQALSATLRGVTEHTGNYKDQLNALLDFTDVVAQRLHKGESLAGMSEPATEASNAVNEELHDEVATLKAELKDLQDHNETLVHQNLELASGRELVTTLQKTEERLQGIELSLIKLTENNKSNG